MKADAIRTDSELVGREVLNVHRESYDAPPEWRARNRGTITGILPGCNALVMVQWVGRDAPVHMVANDLAFVDRRPGEGPRVVIPQEFRGGTA